MTELEQAIYELLASDSAMLALLGTQPASFAGNPGVFQGKAWQSAVAPYVVFFGTPGPDQYSLDGRWGTLYVYTIQAIEPDDSAARAQQIADRIDALVSSGLVVPGFRVDWPHRVVPVAYPEIAEGIVYQHRGGRYALLLIRR